MTANPVSRPAVLFDLDDTLTDRGASIARYARRFRADFLGELGAVDEARIGAVIQGVDCGGYAPREDVFSALLRELAWRRAPDVSRLGDHWEASFPAETAGRDGMRSTLEALRLRGFALGVVTNGREGMQQAKIDALGIRPLLSAVVVSGVVGFDKPDVRIFERGLGELGCVASDVWFVGDHPRNDVIGAAAAGLRAIWLRGDHAWPLATPLPRHQIDRLQDLLDIIPALPTPRGTRLRAFETADASACCEVINAAVVAMDGLSGAAKALVVAKNVPQVLGADLARGFTLVAWGSDGLEGVGVLDGSEVKRVYVHPRFQRRGVGTAMVRALEAEARRRGLPRIELQASPSSVPFYLALGYRALGEETTTNGDAVFVHVRMSRDLA